MNESPFAAAREQGIHVDYWKLGKNIVAIYADLNGYQIVLNSLIDNDSQEDAVHTLLLHHNSELCGVEKVIFKNDDGGITIPTVNLQKGIEKLNRSLNTLLFRRWKLE